MFGKRKETKENTQDKKEKKENKKPHLPPHLPSKEDLNPPNFFNNIFFYIVVGAGILLFMGFITQQNSFGETRPISEALTLIQEGKVQDITISGDDVEVLLKDGTQFVSKKETGATFDDILSNAGIDASRVGGNIEVVNRITFEAILTPLLLFGLPIILIFLIFRQMRGASGEIMSFGRSRAKMFDKGKQQVDFDDVAGNDEAKTELKEIVDFLKNPEKYRKLGARIPKGILLVGPAGVGKTLLAKAIAGEAEVPFYSVAGSEFMEMLVGVGSARARDLFKMAKESQPSLIFIDEIDAIGRQRGMGIGGGHDEREQTLNQILVEMDGFDPRTTVIVMAATNRPDMLDPALVRPGRFDRRVTIPLPDLQARKEIIQIHMKGKPIDEGVDLDALAKNTVGFSGADIENMLNEAAILAARAERDKIMFEDIDEASLKVTIGSERKTMQTEEEKRMTAYHEAGHALVASNLEEMDPVHRVTIVARGGSLGHTMYPPQRDRYGETNERLLAMITSALGGRAAEEIIYGIGTTGASNDIDKATQIARAMVREYGMSELGPVAYHGRDDGGWIAKELSSAPPYSEEMASEIDKQVEKIMNACYGSAKEILLKNRKTLDALVEQLLEKETLTAVEYHKILEETGVKPAHEVPTNGNN